MSEAGAEIHMDSIERLGLLHVAPDSEKKQSQSLVSLRSVVEVDEVKPLLQKDHETVASREHDPEQVVNSGPFIPSQYVETHLSGAIKRYSRNMLGARDTDGNAPTRSVAKTETWDDDLIKRYLNEIGPYKVLTQKEEIELSKRVQAGLVSEGRLVVNALIKLSGGVGLSRDDLMQELDTVASGARAKDTFIKHNLKLVVSVARKFPKDKLSLMELISEGNLGLEHAVDKFEWQRGFKFSTYATWWIKQAISRGVASKGKLIRVPVHIDDDIRKLTVVLRDPTLKPGMTEREAAEFLGWDEEKLENLQQVRSQQLYESIDAPIGESERVETRFGDILPDQDSSKGFDAVDTIDTAYSVLKSDLLSDRERYILALRYEMVDGKSHSLEDISTKLGLTRERIRQIQIRAEVKLRNSASLKLLTQRLLLDDEEQLVFEQHFWLKKPKIYVGTNAKHKNDDERERTSGIVHGILSVLGEEKIEQITEQVVLQHYANSTAATEQKIEATTDALLNRFRVRTTMTTKEAHDAYKNRPMLVELESWILKNIAELPHN